MISRMDCFADLSCIIRNQFKELSGSGGVSLYSQLPRKPRQERQKQKDHLSRLVGCCVKIKSTTDPETGLDTGLVSVFSDEKRI